MTNSSGHTEMAKAKAKALCCYWCLSQPSWDTPAQAEADRVSWAELNMSSSAVWAHMRTKAEWSQVECKPRKHETNKSNVCVLWQVRQQHVLLSLEFLKGAHEVLTPAELRLQLHSDVTQAPPSWNQTLSMQEFNSPTSFRREGKCLF